MSLTGIHRQLVPAVVAFSCAVFAQQPAPTPEQDPARGLAAAQKRIRAEVAGLGEDHAWAGSYYRGDGLGVNITVELAPKAGFAFAWSGCLGVYDQNFGTVQEKDGSLVLTFALPSQSKGPAGLASTLVPVVWGERHYLVASDAMQEFANEVNGGLEPRRGVHGFTLLRRGDEAKKAQGKPKLPREFADLLLDAPIQGMVVAVRDSRVEKGEVLTRRFSTAVIDRGWEHGVRVGMRLHATGVRHPFATILVKKVEARTALVAIEVLGGDEDKAPTEGWTWSTRAPWAR